METNEGAGEVRPVVTLLGLRLKLVNIDMGANTVQISAGWKLGGMGKVPKRPKHFGGYMYCHDQTRAEYGKKFEALSSIAGLVWSCQGRTRGRLPWALTDGNASGHGKTESKIRVLSWGWVPLSSRRLTVTRVVRLLRSDLDGQVFFKGQRSTIDGVR